MTAPDPPRPKTAAPVEIVLAEAAAPHPPRLSRGVRLALRIVPVVMLGAAAWVLWREFHKLS